MKKSVTTVEEYDICEALERVCGFTLLAGRNRQKQRVLRRVVDGVTQLCVICDENAFDKKPFQKDLQYDALKQWNIKNVPAIENVFFIYLGRRNLLLLEKNTASVSINTGEFYAFQGKGFKDIRKALKSAVDMIELKEDLKSNGGIQLLHGSRNMVAPVILLFLMILGFLRMPYLIGSFRYGLSAEFYAEPFRYFAYMFVHADLTHLACSCVPMYFVSRALMRNVNTPAYLVVFFFGGIMSGISSLVYHYFTQNYMLTVGTSGCVFALTGALVMTDLANRKGTSSLKYVALAFVLGFIGYGIDPVLNISGLLIGILFGWIFSLWAGSRKPGLDGSKGFPHSSTFRSQDRKNG